MKCTKYEKMSQDRWLREISCKSVFHKTSLCIKKYSYSYRWHGDGIFTAPSPAPGVDSSGLGLTGAFKFLAPTTPHLLQRQEDIQHRIWSVECKAYGYGRCEEYFKYDPFCISIYTQHIQYTCLACECTSLWFYENANYIYSITWNKLTFNEMDVTPVSLAVFTPEDANWITRQEPGK